MKEKLIETLTPPAPRDASYHGGVKEWKYFYSDESMKVMVDQILVLIQQEIQEIIETIPTEYPDRESDEYDAGNKNFKEQLITNLKAKNLWKEK